MEAYRERVSWPIWFHVLMAVPVGGGAAGLLASVARHGAHPWLLVPAIGIGCVALVWWRVRFLEIEIGTDRVAFGFGGLHRVVPRDRVVSATEETYQAARYMGWGYRLGWEPRERAYSLLGHPAGLRLVFLDDRGRRWNVFLSSANPKAAAAAVTHARVVTQPIVAKQLACEIVCVRKQSLRIWLRRST
jgi:hypothetical protein